MDEQVDDGDDDDDALAQKNNNAAAKILWDLIALLGITRI